MNHLSDSELLDSILRLVEENKVMVAGRYLKILEARLGRPVAPIGRNKAIVEKKLEDLRRLCGRVAQLRRSLESSEGWEVQRDSGGIRCLYQGHESGFIRIRLEAEVEAPLFDLIALLREVGLWHTWVPSFAGIGMSGARQLGQTSVINMCFHLVVNLPWPLGRRSCTFAVDGVDCMHTEDAPQQVVVLLDSRHAQLNCPESVDDWSKVHTPADLWDSGVVITPAEVAGTKHTMVQIIAVMDPKMALPRSLVNLVVRNVCFLIMVQLRRAVAVTREKEHLEITTDPSNPFYAFLRRRMAENMPMQLALAPPLAVTPSAATRRVDAIDEKDDLCCGVSWPVCCGSSTAIAAAASTPSAVSTASHGGDAMCARGERYHREGIQSKDVPLSGRASPNCARVISLSWMQLTLVVVLLAGAIQVLPLSAVMQPSVSKVAITEPGAIATLPLREKNK
ncbi:unnamed protein product [Polarella glacialis]|uniref:START domain-containing protein n=1 Tax=Polarella glacialis TaxID=89957 RepID=A0A813HL49_POLGL|nr:unnamed protein product [Polarella glacialis]